MNEQRCKLKFIENEEELECHRKAIKGRNHGFCRIHYDFIVKMQTKKLVKKCKEFSCTNFVRNNNNGIGFCDKHILCEKEGCNKPREKFRFCQTHFQFNWRHGKTKKTILKEEEEQRKKMEIESIQKIEKEKEELKENCMDAGDTSSQEEFQISIPDSLKNQETNQKSKTNFQSKRNKSILSLENFSFDLNE